MKIKYRLSVGKGKNKEIVAENMTQYALVKLVETMLTHHGWRTDVWVIEAYEVENEATDE